MTAAASKPVASQRKTLIVGLGATGLSVARFLHRHHRRFSVVDDREDPPAYEDLAREMPAVDFHVGLSNERCFEEADDIVVSPGVSLKLPVLRRAAAKNKRIIGDIELFAHCVETDAKVAAITGSNGKSTVASMLAVMAKHSHVRVAAGGNLGRPALDLLNEAADVYVLELSSFQLETTFSMKPAVSVVLNISEDHLDRHGSFDEYRRAKLRVHRNSECVVVNREQTLQLQAAVSFGLDAPGGGNFGVVGAPGGATIVGGGEQWIACSELALPGNGGVLNTQAAFAMGAVLGLTKDAMVATARDFEGLPHRLQKLGSLDGVDWFDDSKATNVAAAVNGLQALGRPAVLICGGLGKGADFSHLRDAVSRHVRALVLIGRDAGKLAAALGGCAPIHRAAGMHEAVAAAQRLSVPGDCVLLAPACASFDMYDGYAERGDDFAREFEALCR